MGYAHNSFGLKGLHSSPSRPLTHGEREVGVVVSRLRGRAVRRLSQDSDWSLGRFRFGGNQPIPQARIVGPTVRRLRRSPGRLAHQFTGALRYYTKSKGRTMFSLPMPPEGARLDEKLCLCFAGDLLFARSKSMSFPKLRALGIALGLFVAVYGPAFVAVSLIRPPAQGVVPLIMAISLAIALVLIFTLGRRTAGVSEFGLSIPKFRYVELAALLGLPLAFAVGWLGHLALARYVRRSRLRALASWVTCEPPSVHYATRRQSALKRSGYRSNTEFSRRHAPTRRR
jgi:hypothetical protein